MRIIAILIALTIAGPFCAAADDGESAQGAQAQEKTAGRPRIGLVLSGGGARGIAHVGVLKALEKMRVPIDCIAGTSMGAIAGGFYASGMTPSEIEKVVTESDWNYIFSDRTPRRELDFERKHDDSEYMVKLELGFNNGHVTFPKGLIAGQKLNLMLYPLTLRAAHINNFDDLPIPFRAVAVDIESGSAKEFSQGVLAEAMRASMSVPGVFSPVEIDGGLYVDGGLLDNLPVESARNMCADIIIAVDVHSQLGGREELETLFDITGQVIKLSTAKNTEKSIALLTDKDILIRPGISDIGSAEFDKAAMAIKAGEDAAWSMEERLNGLSLSPEAYAAYKAGHAAFPEAAREIKYVRLDNNSFVSNERILAKLRVRPGKGLDVEQLNKDITNIYGMGDFEQASYRVERDPRTGDEGVLIKTSEKPWGPNYLRFGLNISDDFNGDSRYNLIASYRMTNINKLGAELRNKFQIGEPLGASSEFYQPLDYKGRVFAAPKIGTTQYRTYVYSQDGIAQYYVVNTYGGLDFGAMLGRWGQIRTGISRSFIRSRPQAGPAWLEGRRAKETGLMAAFNYDTLDNPNFPRRGGLVDVELYSARGDLGSDVAYEKLSIDAMRGMSLGNNTVNISARYGSSLDSDLPQYNQFSLGGFMNLSAYNRGRFSGGELMLYRFAYGFRSGRLAAMGLGDATYLAVVLEAGNVWQSRKTVDMGNLKYSASFIMGMDTVMGPFYLAYSRGEYDDQAFYLYLGRTF